jgi:hypothetical protein
MKATLLSNAVLDQQEPVAPIPQVPHWQVALPAHHRAFSLMGWWRTCTAFTGFS